MSTTIYTIKLQCGKYYVGRSNIPEQRILEHFRTGGSEWTRMFRPIQIISQVKGDPYDEEKYTLQAMERYGVDNVRGGSYCKVYLSEDERKKALQTIRSVGDLCYRCGKKGHFANNCYGFTDRQPTNVKCFYCGKYGHYATTCYQRQFDNNYNSDSDSDYSYYSYSDSDS